MSETQSRTEPTPAQIRAAIEAGASPLFAGVASIPPERVQVGRNHAARKLARSTDPDDPDPEEVRSECGRSGHFINALWDGELAEALYRADAENSRILIRRFDYAFLLAHLAIDRGTLESARRWLDPEIQRYGWPDGE